MVYRRGSQLLLVGALAAAVMLPSEVGAQTTSPTVSEPAGTSTPPPTTETGTTATETTAPTGTEAVENSLAPAEPITEANFNLPAPSTWQFFKRRFVRVFTFNDVKQLELDVELANLTLLAAQDEQEQGDVDRAVQLVDRFDETMTNLSTQATELATTTSQTDAAAGQAILEGIQADRCLQAGLVEQLSENAPADLAAKAHEARATALRDLTKLLTADQPDPAQFAARLAKISERLYEREGKLAAQFAGKLALLDELGDRLAETQDHLKLVLGEVEAKQLDAVKEFDPSVIGEIARAIDGSLGKSALILGALMERVPEDARGAIETTYEASLKRLEQQFAQDPAALKQYFSEDRHADFQEKVLERMADHFGDDSALRSKIEAELTKSKDRAKEWERMAGEYEEKYGAAPSDATSAFPAYTPPGSSGTGSYPAYMPSSGSETNSGSGSYTPPSGTTGTSGSGSYTPPSNSGTSGSGSTYTSPPADTSGSGTSGSGSGTSTPPPTDSSGSSGTTSGSGSGTSTPPTDSTSSGTSTPPPTTGGYQYPH